MAAPFNNNLRGYVSASYLRQHTGVYTNPRQHPPNRLQQPQPAKSRSILTPTVQQQQQQQQQQRNLRKQRIRRHHKESDLSIELPANAASKLALEAEKDFPSHRSKSSTQGTSLSLMHRMQEAMESGEYSDLTILCEDQKFSVHKVVVCSQSKVLAAAMKKGFKESELNLIDLSGDGILLVSHLVTFLYTGNYADEYDSGTPDPTTYTPFFDLSDDDPVESKGHDAHANFIGWSRIDAKPKVADGKIADPEQSPDYSFDVKMYALSDQYDVPALGTLAKAKLEKAFTDHWDSKSFVEIVPRVYESTLESNQGLRTVVLTHARKHAGEFMQEGPLKSSFYGLLATIPEFCTALLSLYMSHSLPLPGKAGGFAGFGTEGLGNCYKACDTWSGRSWGFVDAVDDLDHLGLRTGYELPELPYADPFGHIN